MIRKENCGRKTKNDPFRNSLICVHFDKPHEEQSGLEHPGNMIYMQYYYMYNYELNGMSLNGIKKTETKSPCN